MFVELRIADGCAGGMSAAGISTLHSFDIVTHVQFV